MIPTLNITHINEFDNLKYLIIFFFKNIYSFRLLAKKNVELGQPGLFRVNF